MRNNNTRNSIYSLHTRLALILGIPLLGYTLINIFSLNIINKNKSKFLERHNITVDSLLCELNGSSKKMCTFKSNPEQINILKNILKLESIDTSRSLEEILDLNSKTNQTPEEKNEIQRYQRVLFIEREACWAKFGSKASSKIEAYEVSYEARNIEGLNAAILLYTPLTREGCLQLFYATE
jgi:hypothetical protein